MVATTYHRASRYGGWYGNEQENVVCAMVRLALSKQWVMVAPEKVKVGSWPDFQK